ncbi:MAG: helix-turn-helix transcriptional regulator [Alphaproteobacteria bacterium]|jgi:transcriptional regulator with XRE-family HTH domain|nr:helix-turn-helix transcriptional regulator [Alphaproteobacteria bacterium]MDP6819770.1 helix-turn-helix transcriptional regulator [Alphaproteobacteria bacterium]
MEKEFAARIQALREGLGLTQAKFADTLIVSQGAVSRWEQGKHEPSEQVLAKIAALAGITTAELRYGAPYAPPAEAAPGDADGARDGIAGNGGRPLTIRSRRVRRRVTDLLEDCVIKARSSGKADVATALEVILDKCWADAAHYRKHQREKDEGKQAAGD